MTALLLIGAGLLAGGLGSMLGIGGGVLLVPMLVLGFKVPMEQAIPVSLLCVVASSCGAASRCVDQRLSDLRLAHTLELATVGGAITGGLLAGLLAPATIAIGFGFFVLLVSLQVLLVAAPEEVELPVGGYLLRRLPLGISGSFVAGGVSALLGVGGGPVKVPLMNVGLRVPFKVATGTSNLMIGVTAVASVSGHAWRGNLNFGLAAPLVVGVLGGALVGSQLMASAPTRVLKRLFAIVLLAVSAQMLWKGGTSLWPTL